MSRILFAWEIGSNFGHIARDLPLALEARAAGHAVLFDVTDLNVCRSAAAAHGLRFVQAPEPRLRRLRPAGQAPGSSAVPSSDPSIFHTPPQGAPVALNFADLLLQNGFDDPDFLASAVLGWHGLFELFRPDVLVYDYAPRAPLAARTKGVPVLQAIVVKRKTPGSRRSKHLCADAGYRGRRALEIIESHGYIPHVVGRRKEANAKQRDPTRKARRWVIEVCHSWFNHIAAAIIAFRKVPLAINIIYG